MEQKDTPYNKKLLNEIRRYSLSFPNEESCGLVVAFGQEEVFIACENLSENPEFHFCIDTKIFVENKVLHVYHSHVNASANPSTIDIKYSDELCVPFLIYSIRDDEFKIYENISV